MKRISHLMVLSLMSFAELAAQQAGFAGDWRGSLEAPDLAEPLVIELRLALESGGQVRGSAAVPHDHSPLTGRLPGESGTLRLRADFDDDAIMRLELRLEGQDRLAGEVRVGALVAPMALSRVTGPLRFFHDRGFLLPGDRPASILQSSLDAELAEEVERVIESALDEAHGLGVATGLMVDGVVADLRCHGWEDLAAGIPAGADTMYRWASIAKPLTALAAMQLVESGQLELDRDVRDYVPEFPEKDHPITARQLLTHTGGIVHYGNGPVIESQVEYGVDHPWSDTILCLDRFKESPLIAVPGERYSYTSHGYMLLGAVIQRACGRPFAEQVSATVAEPLGLDSLQPDYPWVGIEHRAVGYRGLRIGLGTLDPERDVSWKLPAGGWVSTIADMTTFAAALLRGDLLEPESHTQMTTAHRLPDGESTGYGYGIGVSSFLGERVLSHSGQQSKANNFMLLCPDREVGVVVLSNTANFASRSLALDLMRLLLRR